MALAGTVLALAGRATAAALPAAFLGFGFGAGRDLETGRRLAAIVFFFAAARVLETGADFFAFLAGAFPVAERLVIGFRRTDLPARLRLLVVDAEV
jgi:hypothetical protein